MMTEYVSRHQNSTKQIAAAGLNHMV